MASIRSENTTPELKVRRHLHGSGLRYRIHMSGLPGKPDLVFLSRRTCVFVHGCFWHGCKRCVDGTRTVKSNSAFWIEKVRKNRERDLRNTHALEANGWKVLTVWECEIQLPATLKRLATKIKRTPKRRARNPVNRAA